MKRITTFFSLTLALVPFLMLVVSVPPSFAFSDPLHARTSQQTKTPKGRQSQMHSTSTSTSPSTTTPAPPPSSSSSEKYVQFENFWGTKIVNSNKDRMPCVPTMDPLDGPLPPGAYNLLGSSETDSKPTCRLALGVTMPPMPQQGHLFDPDEIVGRLQQCLDAGFQTFQLVDEDFSWMIGRLHSQMPSWVETHWAVPMNLSSSTINSSSSCSSSSSSSIPTPTMIRNSILEQCSIMNCEAIDTLLLKYQPTTSNLEQLDVFNTLLELQREGYIRSLGAQNWSKSLLKQAVGTCGFRVDTVQHHGNLLLPSMSTPTPALKGIPQWWTDPLAQDFLTERFREFRLPPTTGWGTIQKWAERKEGKHASLQNNRQQLWRYYQQKVLEPMEYMAEKHQVSISTIALRWAHQCNYQHVKTTLVPLCLLSDEQRQIPLHRSLKELRTVFRFELDEEDISDLNAMVATPPPPAPSKDDNLAVEYQKVKQSEDVPLHILQELEEELQQLRQERQHYGEDDDGDGDGDEYPEIDFSNRALWL